VNKAARPESPEILSHSLIKNVQIRRLDLNLLLIFAAIGRHRKLSAAAVELRLTKSAISHALNRLRDIFEDPLFMREQGGVQPTPRALTLLPKIMTIIQLSNDVLMLDETFDPMNDARELRIGAVEYVEALLAPELIRICREEAPQMRLVFVPMKRSDMIEMIASYRVDLGMGSFIGEASEVDVEAICSDEYVVVGKRDAAQGDTVMSPEYYLAASHVSISSENQPQRFIESVMTTMGVSRRISAFVPHYLTAFGVVARSNCLLTIPRLLAAQLAGPLNLQIHPFPFSHQLQTISILSPHLARHDPALKWLKQKCRDAVVALGSEAQILQQDGPS